MIIRDDDGSLDPLPYWFSPRLPIPVIIRDHATMTDDSVLQLLFETDLWNSLISFEPGIPVQLAAHWS